MPNIPSLQELFSHCRRAVPGLRKEPVAARIERLSALRVWIVNHRAAIREAVYADFQKPFVETDATEILHVLSEIKLARRSISKWTASHAVRAPFFMAGSTSWTQYEPKGVCLIIAPWNYPFSLAIGPLVSALAAGNSVILKPSEATPAVSSLLSRLCHEVFEPSIVSVCEGGPEVSQELLTLPFDHIFFTGSTTVGKIVMKAAAENLSSVTLELGGKSPAIVSRTANINDSAERIAVGKFLNNGQTCIAPDYVLVDEDIAGVFVETLIRKTQELFSPEGDFNDSASYGRIVNASHFNRLAKLVKESLDAGARVEWQGKADPASRFMHPMILTNVNRRSSVMREEIFGPLLPVLSYVDVDEALSIINEKPKALALYVFTSDAPFYEQFLKETTSGTVCINDCGVQFLHCGLPFGGVNHSGFGKSHGYFGFQAFSNEKAVLKQKSGYTPIKVFYPPYTRRSARIMDWFLRLF